MEKHLLHTGWTVRAASNFDEVPAAIRDRDVPATVPGTVHTDLLAEGLIPDPYLDRNEDLVQWIGRTDWVYSCRFDAPQGWKNFQRVDLACEGLDTVARVELNGHVIGESENMHHPHRFDAKAALHDSENELVVTFASAAMYTRAMRDQLGDLPNTYPDFERFNFIRKMACNFGWDWGPTLITAGIWKPIALEMWNTARIKSVRPLVQQATEKFAIVDVKVEVERADPSDETRLSVGAILNKKESASSRYWISEQTVTILVRNPQLWWPRGYGDPVLNDLYVHLLHEEETEILNEGKGPVSKPVLDRWEARIGLREVTMNTEPDAVGEQWTIEINGKPIWIKGANWIPDDCFPHRVDEMRYRQRIQQAIDSNMNLLRIWGGGTYESETFYSICDELGVLVWQDFPFACACYPEEAPFDKLIEAEARHNIARLSRHPSLVMWNGSNENIWGYFDWPWQGTTWREFVEGRTWGLGFYLDLLPRLVQELDPTRPYWPSSPYSGTMEIHPLADTHGNMHIWDAWNTADYTVYREYSPRFCSEFGHQAPPTYTTLQRSIPADQLRPDSPAMLHHQKANGGNDKLHTRLEEHFEIPQNVDDWLYVTQLNQARALTLGVEWFRSQQPRCMGTIYWQINDCWPVTSWASVDGYGHPKPLWYATRRFFADRLLTIQPDGDDLVLFANNDSDAEWNSALRFTVQSFSGETEFESSLAVNVAPRTNQSVLRWSELSRPKFDGSNQFIAVRSPEARTEFFGQIDKNLSYPEPRFDADLQSHGIAHQLTITARTLLRDLCIFVERLDEQATVNDQLVTLLPGESFTFEINSPSALHREDLIAPPVLQCANRFGRSA
jgi:beta-mannosidase